MLTYALTYYDNDLGSWPYMTDRFMNITVVLFIISCKILKWGWYAERYCLKECVMMSLIYTLAILSKFNNGGLSLSNKTHYSIWKAAENMGVSDTRSNCIFYLVFTSFKSLIICHTSSNDFTIFSTAVTCPLKNWSGYSLISLR